MSQDNPPAPEIDPAKVKAFALLWDVAFGQRKPTPKEADLILSHLTTVLKYDLDCFFTIWSPSDIQDYAEGNQCLGDGFEPTYDQAKAICRNLEDYEHLYSEVNEAVRNELITLRNSGANE